MLNNDLVKCPLCHSFTHVENPEFQAALKNPRVRAKIEKYVAELVNPPLEELVNVAAGKSAEPQNAAHTWNPCVPRWQRSPKE